MRFSPMQHIWTDVSLPYAVCPFVGFLYMFGCLLLTEKSKKLTIVARVWRPKWLICLLLLSGLRCDSGYWLGSKSSPIPPPSSPFFLPPPLLTPSESFCSPSHQRLPRDESLAELNRHTCVTPGYRAHSLWSPFLTDGPFCFWALCWGPPPEKYIGRAFGTMYWVLHLHKCGRGKLFHPQQGVPS